MLSSSSQSAPRPSPAADYVETPRASLSSHILSRESSRLNLSALIPRRTPSPLFALSDEIQAHADSLFYLGSSSSMSGPSTSMSGPSTSMSGPSPSISPVTSATQQRMSLSGRPRRPSPLLHEIQPPGSRLSALQVLLLTPFGTQLPSAFGRDAGGWDGMERGSSGMPSTAAPNLRDGMLGGHPSLSRMESASMGTLSASPTSMGMRREEFASSGPRPFQRARQGSPMGYHAFSPLAESQPMTTISSESDGSDQNSTAQASWQGQRENEDDTILPAMEALWSATGAMTRSSSLPVLTLREFHALQQKDGELAIVRGGGWAWVSGGRASEEESADESCVDCSSTPSVLSHGSLQNGRHVHLHCQ